MGTKGSWIRPEATPGNYAKGYEDIAWPSRAAPPRPKGLLPNLLGLSVDDCRQVVDELIEVQPHGINLHNVLHLGGRTVAFDYWGPL